MFKLVVLCAFLAVAAAEPKPAFFAAPALTPAILSPAARIFPASSYVYQSPLVSTPLSYSAPLGYAHLIKKRSAPLVLSPYSFPSSYIAPGSYSYSSPIVSTYSAAAPLVPAIGSGLVYSSGAHLIKKRSAPLYSSAYITPSSYIAPVSYAATAPFVATTYSAPVVSTPLISSAPISYATHLIKKRSAPLAVAAYAAPGAYSHQSRFDFKASGPVAAYSSYIAPLSYSSPIVYSHVY
ncbi:cuticle protein 16.5-like [Danaus plexippus]|uniref:cuticle protein 16.5-like n=1 Tax=Danaus plexippus TaxID=13037 RepID=UPI002AAF6E0E|nr:cuticle protein 16.5-like [Danaus plexippus]